MKIVNVETQKLVPNKWNPNKQSDFIFEKELQSIKENGFIDPVLVREKQSKFEIIDGEHRWRAAIELKLKKIPIVNLGKVPDSKAKKLTIIMNEVKGSADEKLLGDLIKDLENSVGIDDLLLNLPYTEDELKKLTIMPDINWDDVSSKPKGESSSSDEEEDGDEKIFQIKLLNETHDQLIFQLNRIKIQMKPGSNPIDVPNSDAFEIILKHIQQIPDEQLII